MKILWLGLLVLAACGGGVSPECAGLSLAECRLAAGCQVDSCESCSCAPTYRGCVPQGVAVSPCPALGCPSPPCCDSQADCTDTATCVVPGTPPGCGACDNTPGSCTDDAQCAGTMICEPIRCACDGMARACAAGCTDDSTCAEGLACNTGTNRCEPRACGGAADCPENFDCTGGACVRRACADDLACDGFCVQGSCFASLGECRLPVP